MLLPSSKNQINKIESTKAWGKSPFVTSTDAYTQAHIILTYTFFLNLYMHLWTFTCACRIWLLPSSFEFCVVWGMTRLFLFFFLFFVFSVSVALFFLFRFFFSPKSYFIKKKTKYKKEIPVLLVCKFLLIKGDGQLNRHTDKQISWLINTNYRCEKEVKYFLCYTARMVKKWLQLFFFFLFYTEQFKRQKTNRKNKKTMIKWKNLQ